MSLFDEGEEIVTRKDPIPVIVEPQYKSHTVDSRYTPHAALLTSISGYPWTVDYYSSVLGQDDGLDELAPNRSPVHQQYRRIRAFEIKVSTPLDRSQDDTIKTMAVTGSANVYPCLIPNAGDQFIADIGNGQSGLFTVTETERLSHFREPVHRINYQLIDYVKPEHLFDLESKVVKTVHFRREYLDYAQSPFIEDEVIHWVRELEQSYSRTLDQFFAEHWSREYATLLVPGQSYALYDPYVVRTMCAFFLAASNPYFQKIRTMNVGEDDVLRASTILDVILSRHTFDPHSIVRRVGLVSAKEFDRLPSVHSIYYSGINKVIYPRDQFITADYQRVPVSKTAFDLDLQNERIRDTELKDVFVQIDLPKFSTKPIALIHPVLKDDYYIFSQAFYEKSEEQSLLEVQVHLYLERKSPNPEVLAMLLKSYPRWGSLERFYYTPVLLLLIYANLRSL